LESAGIEAVGFKDGDTSAGVKFAGFEGLRVGIEDVSVGVDATGLDEEVDVSEVGDELQPVSTISKPARNHRDFIRTPPRLEIQSL
jgi:hypothetical protein